MGKLALLAYPRGNRHYIIDAGPVPAPAAAEPWSPPEPIEEQREWLHGEGGENNLGPDCPRYYARVYTSPDKTPYTCRAPRCYCKTWIDCGLVKRKKWQKVIIWREQEECNNPIPAGVLSVIVALTGRCE